MEEVTENPALIQQQYQEAELKLLKGEGLDPQSLNQYLELGFDYYRTRAHENTDHLFKETSGELALRHKHALEGTLTNKVNFCMREVENSVMSAAHYSKNPNSADLAEGFRERAQAWVKTTENLYKEMA